MQPTGKTYSKGPTISAEADKNSRSPSPQITTDRTTRAAEMSQKDGDTGVDPSQASSNNNPVFQVGGATLAQRSSFLIEDILFQRPKVIPSHSVLSSFLLIKHIPSAIMGQFALLGPPKKDFGMDNFFYWANIAHHLF